MQPYAAGLPRRQLAQAFGGFEVPEATQSVVCGHQHGSVPSLSETHHVRRIRTGSRGTRYARGLGCVGDGTDKAVVESFFAAFRWSCSWIACSRRGPDRTTSSSRSSRSGLSAAATPEARLEDLSGIRRSVTAGQLIYALTKSGRVQRNTRQPDR